MTERTITAYKNYFLDFIQSLDANVSKKIFYVLDMLKSQNRISENLLNIFVKEYMNYVRNMKETSIAFSFVLIKVMW
jgi:hypothetical protein